MAKNTLKTWLVDNTVTTDNKTDKIFPLETTRSVDKTVMLDRMVLLNESSRIIFNIPVGLEDGEYTLSVTTQYKGSSTEFLKTLRTTSQTLDIGAAPSTGGGS